ncbi:MAG: S8 family serine peptidase [Actinomycetota bacterium]
MAQSFKGQKMDFVPLNRLSFTEKKGVQEFTGTMIARPLQLSAYRRQGLSDFTAQAGHIAAEAQIGDLTQSRIAEIDCYVIRVPAGMTENSLARTLMATGLFEYVEPNYRVFPAFVPNDTLLGSQWSHSNNSSTEGWDICRGNASLIVALTDTGVHLTHEDLAGNRAPGANSATAADVASVKTEGAFGSGVVKDLNGHGSHTTGIAAAIGDNAKGVCGVNIAGTRHLMVRVSDSAGGGSTLNALSIGALWAAQNGCRVISTSYTGVQNSIMGTTGTTIKNTWNALWCYAAGNDGGTYGTSVDWPDVTIVGSIMSNNAISGFSARGDFIDVMAPGSGILSTYWNNDAVNNTYATLDGTSMATPFAAGLATLILAENPNYSAQRVEDILYKSSINNGAVNVQGWGRVNLWNAVGRKANSFVVGPGFLVSGGLTDLYRIEGSNLIARPGIVPNVFMAPIQVTTVHNVPAYASNNYGEIDIMTQVALVGSTGSVTQRLMIFNNSTGLYETVTTGPVNGTFLEGTFPVNAGNFANYIVGGTVKVKVEVFQSGPLTSPNWQASFDQINVRTLRATQ